MRAIVLLALLALALVSGCGRSGSHGDSGGAREESAEWFVDATKASGLDFTHDNGMSGEYYFPEHVAPGVGLLDFDNDGDLDVFVVQGYPLSTGVFHNGGSDRSHDRHARGARLFRNDLTVRPDGTRVVQFTDVTAESRIDARGYGMGVATGDFDNNGCVDLYVTNVGPNQLWRNNCDGTFTDVSRAAGVDDPGFGVSASFVDYNRDGLLDLYVGNYVQYSPETNVVCRSVTGKRDYCSPHVYRAQRDRLYKNRGDGRFEDVTESALAGGDFGPALGVVADDFDGDGWPDIFVANDGEPNLLWMNQRDGTFRNQAKQAGVALNADGRAVASMGVDAGDLDNDGDDDLFVTTLSREMNVLFVNKGSGVFEDESATSGLGAASLAYTGWGTSWIDFDNDGWLDLLTVNGTIQAQPGRAENRFPYDQRKQLFRNTGNGRFEEVSSRAGAVFGLSEVGRGAAFGDVDNDGSIDVVVANDNGPVRLLLNRKGRLNHWVGLRLVGGPKMPRDMIGARVAVSRTGGVTLTRRVHSDGSYASASDPRVLVGLGADVEPPSVRVTWPDGRVEHWSDLPIDRWTTLEEGTRP